MRSPYEEFGSVSTNYNNNNNNNTSSSRSSTNYYSNNIGSRGEDVVDHSIPYHARENSQPFSYGQIYKTSTPLRNGRSATNGGTYHRGGAAAATASWERDIDKFDYAPDSDTYTNNNNKYYNSSYNSRNPSAAQAATVSEGSMIKAQPRLTSPLLVRKTLNSRSPTRNPANTIANTYHYSYERSSNNNNINGGNNKYGYNGDSNNKYSSDFNISSSSNTYENSALRKTPTRNDFEELLRERRAAVYAEHRSTAPPTQLAATATTTPSNKYNFDFEFNLNLEEQPLPPPPRRAYTMERTSLQNRNNYAAPQTESVLERNYTISSSRDVRAETFGNSGGRSERPAFELMQSRRLQSPQHAVAAKTTTMSRDFYGNENASVYGYGKYASNNNNNNNDDDILPIYATSLKQKQQQPITTTSHLYERTRRSEPELTLTDYASAKLAAAASPTLVSRPETPAFPVTPRTPYGVGGSINGHNAQSLPPRSPTPQLQQPPSETPQQFNIDTIYYRSRLNSSLSLANSEPQEVAPHLVKFAKDSSRFWYKATLSRDEAIALLLHAPPGTFVVRDSTTYKRAYGLVLRVAQPPPGGSTGKPDELVRHFLIEPTTRGVRLKGCANEPVFTSLSALVYEHSINALALPCALQIPEHDLVPPLVQHTPAQRQLLTQGAACNVLWLYSCDTESLTGEEAIRKAIRQMYALPVPPTPTEVHFKVAQQGITLTDNTRKKFFRKHYVADMISYCAIDPDHRLWSLAAEGGSKKTIFAFVARRSPSSQDNQCHVFCDLAVSQPASAIVSFANKTLPTEQQSNYVL